MIIVGTTVLAALLDLWTSADLIWSILFTLPLTLCSMQRSKRLLWGTVAVVVLLTIAAEFWGFHRVSLVNPFDGFHKPRSPHCQPPHSDDVHPFRDRSESKN
jgi:hypothetical protein